MIEITLIALAVYDIFCAVLFIRRMLKSKIPMTRDRIIRIAPAFTVQFLGDILILIYIYLRRY